MLAKPPSSRRSVQIGTGTEIGTRTHLVLRSLRLSPSILNQVQYAYNGFGQVTVEYQAHTGAANTSTSPKTQYAYTEGLISGTPVNHSRLSTVTRRCG